MRVYRYNLLPDFYSALLNLLAGLSRIYQWRLLSSLKLHFKPTRIHFPPIFSSTLCHTPGETRTYGWIVINEIKFYFTSGSYNFDAFMSSIEILQFADANFERGLRDVFGPSRGCVVLHSKALVHWCHKNDRCRAERSLTRKKKLSAMRAKVYNVGIWN